MSVIQLYIPYLYYSVLVALMFQLPWKLWFKKSDWFKKHFAHNKYVFWSHGIIVFTIMWLCQPQNLKLLVGSDLNTCTLVKYGLSSLLAVVLWDFGYSHDVDLKSQILINTHHVGLFAAMFFGPGWNLDRTMSDEDLYIYNNNSVLIREEMQVDLDTRMFGWLWFIHSFGFILQIVLPYVFGVKLEGEGKRSLPHDFMKHCYAFVSVYFFHRYMNFDSDRFFTYQTCSLLVMLTGRYLFFWNCMRVDFFRRVEFPGFLVVLFDRVLGFQDVVCQRSCVIVISLYGLWALYAVFCKEMPSRPLQYFGPKENPKLRKFLDEQTDAIHGVSKTKAEHEAAKAKWISRKEGTTKWWDDKKTKEGKKWKDIYPIYDSIVLFEPGNNIHTKKFIKLLDTMGEAALDETHKHWFDSVPVGWSTSLQYPYECTLILLKRGANPYILDSNGDYPVGAGIKEKSKISSSGEPGALGFSDGFWKKFHEICLEKSPPKVLSKWEKFQEIIKRF